MTVRRVSCRSTCPNFVTVTLPLILPAILAGLKAKGFKVVHLRAKAPVVPLATLDAELQPVLAKARTRDVMPFYGPAPDPKTADGLDPATSELAPPARTRRARRRGQGGARDLSRGGARAVLCAACGGGAARSRGDAGTAAAPS